MRKFLVVFSILVSSFLFCLLGFSEVKAASYMSVCNDDGFVGVNESYKKCGTNNLYIDMNHTDHSSYLVSSNEAYSTSQIIYVGQVEGIETFYSVGFRFFGFVHDERSWTYHKGDYWSTVSIDGVTVYDGGFTDNWYRNESINENVVFYNQKGTYLISQYINGSVSNTIRVIVVNEKDHDMSISSIKYGDKEISGVPLVGVKDDLIVEVAMSKYGYNKSVDITFNECNFNVQFASKIIIDNNKIEPCLIHNGRNSLYITLYNGFNISNVFKYRFDLSSSKITINLENSVSKLVTSSRRIVINAKAGSGKSLDENYNLYYWSKQANDKLTYEDFMSNYEKSEYKGAYSSNKGVILRNTEGTYYLYALAKDDDSSLVVRSEEYVLKADAKINKVIIDDVIIVCVLGVISDLAILAYLILRGKDTD